MKNIITVLGKELRSQLNDPTAYIVVLAFLMLWEFLFFRSVFLVGEASLRSLFEILPWIVMIVVPALTMGSIAQEKNEGTLEFLLTHPINQVELIVGKFLGVLSFFAITLLFVFPLAWSLNLFGNLDWGQTVSQYLAGILMTSVLASLGIFISGFFISQISAFLVSAVSGFFLVIAGTEMVSSRMPLSLATFLDQLSLLNHFDSMSRGVIDFRDIWYFVSFTAIFLAFTYLNLIKSKYGNRKAVYRNYQTALVLMVGIVLLSNVVGSRIPGRIDLTEGKIYTLSPSTKKIAAELPDIVNISLYASEKLPAQLQPTLREVKDTLEDYRTASKGKIRVSYKNPSSDSKVAQEAVSMGIQPVRFNVVSQEEFQIKEGYLGIAVSYGGNHESIPFLENINDLEYQLSGFLIQLTNENKPKIGFLSGHGEKSFFEDYGTIGEELKKQFDVETIVAKSDEAETPTKNADKKTAATAIKRLSFPKDVKTIIIAGPTQDFSDEEKKDLGDFFGGGGSALVLVDGVSVSTQTMVATANEKGPIGFIKDLTGTDIKKDLIYDLRSNETIRFGGGAMNYIAPYPFWIRVGRTSSASPITSKLESMMLPWASTIEVDKKKIDEKGYELAELFSTTQYAGTKTSEFNIAPDQKLSQQDLSKKLVAVALAPKQGESSQSRFVVVGDSDFLSDQYVKNNANNYSFALEAISWLSQEPALSRIAVKNLAERKFTFENSSQPTMIKLSNLAFVFLLTSGYGSWRLLRRRRMKEMNYME